MADKLKLRELPQEEVQRIKDLARDLYISGEKTATEVISELGLSPPTFYLWASHKTNPEDLTEKTWHDQRTETALQNRNLIEKYKELEEIGNDFEELHKMNLSDVAKATAIGMAKLKRLLLSDNPLPLIGEIQKLSGALEKQGNAYYKDKNKGVDKSSKQVNHVHFDMDDVFALMRTFRSKGVEISWEEASKILRPDQPALPEPKKQNDVIEAEVVKTDEPDKV